MSNAWFTEKATEEKLASIERGFAFVRPRKFRDVFDASTGNVNPRDTMQFVWSTEEPSSDLYGPWTRWSMSEMDKQKLLDEVRVHLEQILNGARFTAALNGKNVVEETAGFFHALWKNGLLRMLAVAQQLLEPDELVLLDAKMDPPR